MKVRVESGIGGSGATPSRRYTNSVTALYKFGQRGAASMNILSVTMNTQGERAIVRLNARPIFLGSKEEANEIYDRLNNARNLGESIPVDLLDLYNQSDPSTVNPSFDSPSTQRNPTF
jgi:hypothetical protein